MDACHVCAAVSLRSETPQTGHDAVDASAEPHAGQRLGSMSVRSSIMDVSSTPTERV
jgi:hypothetical protein